MSQKKTLLKYTKYVMWGTVALIPPAAFFYLLEFLHTQSVCGGMAMGAAF